MDLRVFLCNFALKKIKFGKMFESQFWAKLTIFLIQNREKQSLSTSSVKKFRMKSLTYSYWIMYVNIEIVFSIFSKTTV